MRKRTARKRFVAIVTTLLAAAALPASAAGQSGDNASIGEYVEELPGPGGDRPGSGEGGGSGGGNGGGDEAGGGAGTQGSDVGGEPVLSGSAERKLASLGDAGVAAAALAEATAPEQGGGGGEDGAGGKGSVPGADGDGEGTESGATVEGESGSWLGELASSLFGASDGGLGPALPALLLLGALGAVAFWIVRRRGAGESTGGESTDE